MADLVSSLDAVIVPVFVVPVRVRCVPQLPSLSVEVLADLDYSPALLLPAPWSTKLAFARSADYARSCRDGFEAYLDELHEWDESRQIEIVGDRVLSWVDLLHNVIFEFAIVRGGIVPEPGQATLAQRAGFGLGWLSAYAFRARQDAMLALGLLALLVEAELRGRRIEYSVQAFCALLDAR